MALASARLDITLRNFFDATTLRHLALFCRYYRVMIRVNTLVCTAHLDPHARVDVMRWIQLSSCLLAFGWLHVHVQDYSRVVLAEMGR